MSCLIFGESAVYLPIITFLLLFITTIRCLYQQNVQPYMLAGSLQTDMLSLVDASFSPTVYFGESVRTMVSQCRLGWSGCIALLITLLRESNAARTGDKCRFRYPPNRVIATVFVLEHQLAINTDVQKNHSFAINTDLTITVDNAPTSLDFTTTYTQRSTLIRTAAG